jgi:predicted GNAT family acetyltransferase
MTHYIWENPLPVSQARHARDTVNGGVLSSVYTPPQFRGNGYATTLVSELSQLLLDEGKRFVCLFADAANPVSCGIYRKIGFTDVCVADEIEFK